MFKNLRDVDFEINGSPDLSKMFKSDKTLRTDITLPLGQDAAALEGLFGDSKEEKIKKFKAHWDSCRDSDLESSQHMLTDKNSLAGKMQSDAELFKNKLTGKTLNLKNITAGGMSYTDMITGLEGTIALPEFVQSIFAIPPNQIFKNDMIMYSALKNPPIPVRKAFVVSWDRQLTFRPEYHYKNGSKLHENEYLEKLGYSETNILQMINHVEAAIAAYHKLAAILPELKKQYGEYEALGVSAISNGELPKNYWSKLICLTHLLSPLWYEATAYSLRGFTEKALDITKEVALRH